MNIEKNFDPGKEFEKELRTTLESIHYGFSEVSWNLLKGHAMKVMELNSITALNCDVKTYTSIVNVLQDTSKNGFNLFNISFLLNGFNLVSPKDLNISAIEYSEICHYVSEKMKEWNKEVDPIKKKIANKIQTRMDLSKPHMGKLVNPNNRKRR